MNIGASSLIHRYDGVFTVYEKKGCDPCVCLRRFLLGLASFFCLELMQEIHHDLWLLIAMPLH